jgi:uncharacterized protein YodC (DUF2158 family)
VWIRPPPRSRDESRAEREAEREKAIEAPSPFNCWLALAKVSNVEVYMAEQRFANGALVRLKSGGPQMTVKEFGDYITGQQEYLCTWFDGKGQRQEERFAEHELELADAGTGG